MPQCPVSMVERIIHGRLTTLMASMASPLHGWLDMTDLGA